jgi:hypothetical protein
MGTTEYSKKGDGGGTNIELANHAGLYRELQKAVKKIVEEQPKNQQIMLDCTGNFRRQ